MVFKYPPPEAPALWPVRSRPVGIDLPLAPYPPTSEAMARAAVLRSGYLLIFSPFWVKYR